MKEHKEALARIINERLRQIAQEEYTYVHDDEHIGGQLALLAAAYALASCPGTAVVNMVLREIDRKLTILKWSFKPVSPMRDLERAGALILAEMERRLRKE